MSVNPEIPQEVQADLERRVAALEEHLARDEDPTQLIPTAANDALCYPRSIHPQRTHS